MRNIKLTIRFNGSAYHGWQIQKNAITIQEVLAKAVSESLNEPIPKIVGCGRTDSGVHAQMYVANFKTESSVPADRIPLALNSKLPYDIVCLSAEEVEDAFDASGSAVKKCYTYRILNSKIPDPFLFPFTYHVKFPLDIDKMKQAAAHFVGTHDFVGFAASGFTVKTTIRTVYSVIINKDEDVITIEITGNGFLYNMVRIIAGTLISVGRGEIHPDMIPDIILSKDRDRAGITAPAKGLCLTEVFY